MADKPITHILDQLRADGRDTLNELLPVVYQELRRLAGSFLSRERSDHTLQPTALVHEAYLRLVDQSDINWQSRTQFFAFAAKVMRNVLVDHARGKRRQKRGGDAPRVSLEDAITISVDEQDIDLMALDEALNRLAQIDEQQVRLVELRYFSGLSLEMAAEVLKISRATAARDWNVARAWLHRELTR